MRINVKEIMTSYVDKLTTPPSDPKKTRAEERLAICADCEFVGERPISGQKYCTKCGCYLAGKVWSPIENVCPEKKWAEPDAKYARTLLEKNKKSKNLV